MSEELRNIERIAGLIIKYHRESYLDKHEHEELEKWCELSTDNRQLFNKLMDINYVKDKINEFPDLHALKESGWEKVWSVIAAEDSSIIMMPGRRRTSWV